jgi:hypothetical protein
MRAALLLLVVLTSGCATRQAIEAGSERTVDAARWADSLTSIAASRPCAAAALWYLENDENESGTLLLDPSRDLLRAHDSDQPILVEVSWSVRQLNGVSLFTTRARLAHRDGFAFSPAHVVEPTTTVMISGGRLYLLRDGDEP